jgi:predicted acetyltransferase
MHTQPQLVRPAIDHLPSYTLALAQGWSLDLRGPAAAAEQRARVEQDPAAFLAALENRAGQGAPLQLPDGSLVPRLPGIQRWIWDGEFCGAVSLRWVEGSAELPAYCLGHVGYGVVPWKRGRGYASSALGQILPEARAIGLPHVDLTTDPDNHASRRVIERNSGTLVKAFTKPAQYGGKPGLLFRISLGPSSQIAAGPG